MGKRWWQGALFGVISGAAAAETAAGPPLETAEVTLGKVTVSATKDERRLDEVPATVTVIDAADLQRNVVENISDLVRYEPGVSVPYQGSRFGRSGFTIRGLGGNRVQIEIDGVPIPDGFSIGDFSNAGRDFVDLDNLKRIEIVRGSASSLYGSDALGGVVSFTTKDPLDYLAGPDDKLAVQARGGYASADDTWIGGGTVAGRNGAFSGLFSAVERSGDQLSNKGNNSGTGSTRTQPDPNEAVSQNLLAKLVYGETSDAPIKLTLERLVDDSDTNSLSAVRAVSPTTRTTALAADDQARRARASLEQTLFDLGPLNSLLWRVYVNDSRTRQDTLEARTISTGGGSMRERQRRALFKQQVIGGETTATGTLETGPLAHRWVAGFELERIRTMQSRNGTERNLTVGTEASTIGPDAFPVRDFPITNTIEAGFYAQDDIRYGALTVIPGLRVDYYDLDPRPDRIFIEDNPGVDPSGLNKLNLSPKLGLIWRFNERLSAYGNYARGFRAPPYSDVNVGFTNVQFGYTAIPNPDLKPETSNSFEVGLRGGVEDAMASVAAFYNRYRNFIQSFVSQGVNADGLLVFQSQNLTRVRIFGAEAKGELGGALLDDSLKAFHLRGALAWAKGDDLSANVPLNSIDPLTGVVGLAWRSAALPVSAELVSTMTIEDSRTDNTSGQGYQAPGTVRVDLLGEWHVTPKADFNLGLFNLGDRRIVPAASVQSRLANDPAIDRFSQPGFNVGANVRLRF